MSEVSDHQPNLPKRIGRPPIGNRAMTGRERMARSRARLAEAGGYLYSVRIDAERWRLLTKAASAKAEPHIVVGALLREIIDRYIEVQGRVYLMIDAGCSAEEIKKFYRENLFPPLPPLPGERSAPTTDK